MMAYKSDIPQFKKQLLSKQEQVLEAIGVFVEGETVTRCPVGVYPKGSGRVGGNLKSSYNHEVNMNIKEVRIGSPVHYAPYVNFGTYKMKPRPHLEPALFENIERIKELVKMVMAL